MTNIFVTEFSEFSEIFGINVIQDLVKRGPQLPRQKVAGVAQWSHTNEVSYIWQGSRALKQALEALGF